MFQHRIAEITAALVAAGIIGCVSYPAAAWQSRFEHRRSALPNSLERVSLLQNGIISPISDEFLPWVVRRVPKAIF